MDHRDELNSASTDNNQYAERLVSLQTAWWKETFFFLNPYLVSVRLVTKGKVLEVGSGIGRNLRVLRRGSLGVDHNIFAVEFAKNRGLNSLSVIDFFKEPKRAQRDFDTLLLSHVLEHVDYETQEKIFYQYIPHLKSDAKIVLICPQEAGFNSDPTHIRWIDENTLKKVLESLECEKIKINSFPLPRWAGKRFTYNQTVATGILKSPRSKSIDFSHP